LIASGVERTSGGVVAAALIIVQSDIALADADQLTLSRASI
jgi:hypothetical protein